MNFVMFQGHLTADPVIRQNQDGKPWCSGKIGVWQGKDQQGNDLDSIFIDFVCYGNDATTMGQLGKKGDLVIISGTFKETKNIGTDGNTYINKRVSGNAKLCKKLENQPAQPQQVYGQPAQPQKGYNQPTYAQPQPQQVYNQPTYAQPQQGLSPQHQAQVDQLFGNQQNAAPQSPWGNL